MEGKQKTRRWCAWSHGFQLAPPPNPLDPPPYVIKFGGFCRGPTPAKKTQKKKRKEETKH